MPATLTSLIKGSEMLPSVRTTTVCETSGSFQTVTRSTSDSPTMYSEGTTSGSLVSAGLSASAGLVASTGLVESAALVVSAAFVLSAASGDFRSALWVWASNPAAPKAEQNTTILTITFL